MNDTSPNTKSMEKGQILEENAIGAIWQICFVANSFVFPIYAHFDKEYGISRMEFVVLYVLAHRDKLMAWEICRMTGLPKNNISRGVKKLESKALIERYPDPADARQILLVISKSGRELFEELVAKYSFRADGFLSLLDDDDKSDLERIMVKLSRSVPDVG